jgi:hypothetical protein
MSLKSGTVGWARTTDLLFHRQFYTRDIPELGQTLSNITNGLFSRNVLRCLALYLDLG